jgi:hypothetical protein
MDRRGLVARHQLVHQSVPFTTILELITGVDKHDFLPQFSAGAQKGSLLGRQLNQAGTGCVGDTLGHELGVDLLAQGKIQEGFRRPALFGPLGDHDGNHPADAALFGLRVIDRLSVFF